MKVTGTPYMQIVQSRKADEYMIYCQSDDTLYWFEMLEDYTMYKLFEFNAYEALACIVHDTQGLVHFVKLFVDRYNTLYVEDVDVVDDDMMKRALAYAEDHTRLKYSEM